MRVGLNAIKLFWSVSMPPRALTRSFHKLPRIFRGSSAVRITDSGSVMAHPTGKPPGPWIRGGSENAILLNTF